MSQLIYTVALPEGATGGAWRLTPLDHHAIPRLQKANAFPLAGAISAAGVLRNAAGTAAPDVLASVPGTDPVSPDYVLEIEYTDAGGRRLPGRPLRLSLVETSAGVVDVAVLVAGGLALSISPEQMATFEAVLATGRGPAGATWRTGAGLPSNALGADDDLYLDTATGNVYKRAGGVYSVVDNLTGPVGPQGATWRTGAGVPSNALGANGDYWLNSTNGDYYLRAAGTYTLQGNLRGPAGLQGPSSTWRNGSGVPSNATGIDGDYYLDTATGDVYRRAAGVYTVQGNIRGPSGPAGNSWTWLHLAANSQITTGPSAFPNLSFPVTANTRYLVKLIGTITTGGSANPQIYLDIPSGTVIGTADILDSANDLMRTAGQIVDNANMAPINSGTVTLTESPIRGEWLVSSCRE